MNPKVVTLFRDVLTPIKPTQRNYVSERDLQAFAGHDYLFWIRRQDFLCDSHVYTLNFYEGGVGGVERIPHLEAHQAHHQVASFVSGEQPRFLCFARHIVISITKAIHNNNKKKILLYQFIRETSKFHYSGHSVTAQQYDLYHDLCGTHTMYILLAKDAQTKCLELGFYARHAIKLTKVRQTLQVSKLTNDSHTRSILAYNPNLLIILLHSSQSMSVATWDDQLHLHQFDLGAYEILHLAQRSKPIQIVVSTQQCAYQIYPTSHKADLERLANDLQQTSLNVAQLDTISLEYVEGIFLLKLIMQIPAIDEFIKFWDTQKQVSMQDLLLTNTEHIDASDIIYCTMFALKHHPPYAVMILRYLELVAQFCHQEDTLIQIYREIKTSIPYVPRLLTYLLIEVVEYNHINEWIVAHIKTKQRLTDLEKISLFFESIQ